MRRSYFQSCQIRLLYLSELVPVTMNKSACTWSVVYPPSFALVRLSQSTVLHPEHLQSIIVGSILIKVYIENLRETPLNVGSACQGRYPTAVREQESDQSQAHRNDATLSRVDPISRCGTASKLMRTSSSSENTNHSSLCTKLFRRGHNIGHLLNIGRRDKLFYIHFGHDFETRMHAKSSLTIT